MENSEDKQKSDEQLMEEVKLGSVESFRRIYEKYKSIIYNYLYHFLGNRQTAEDCAQDVFIHLYQKANLYNPTAKFSSWLYKMAKNAALDAFRKNKIRKTVSLDTPLETEESRTTLGEFLSKEGEDPRSLSVTNELAELVKKAIAHLGEKDREVLVLCDIQQLPHKEVGEILGYSAQTVTVKLYRARQHLAEILKIEGDF